MRERLTEDTLCTLCGEPLGMDSGHHVTGERNEKGDPYHPACLEADLHTATRCELLDLQRRFEDLEAVTVEALAFMETTVAAGYTPSLAKRLEILNARLDVLRKHRG